MPSGRKTTRPTESRTRTVQPEASVWRISAHFMVIQFLSFNFPWATVSYRRIFIFPCDVGDFCRILKPLSSPRIYTNGRKRLAAVSVPDIVDRYLGRIA